jgi:hypothetical protein
VSIISGVIGDITFNKYVDDDDFIEDVIFIFEMTAFIVSKDRVQDDGGSFVSVIIINIIFDE